MIRAYLQGETYEPKQVKKLQPKKPKAPLQAQPEAPVSLEKKMDSTIEPSKGSTAATIGGVEPSQKEDMKRETEHEKDSFATITLSKTEKAARTGTTCCPYAVQTHAYSFMAECYP